MNRTFALVGNPNVGKTSLYNRLTNSTEHVGNWHGVTVDKVSKVTSVEKGITLIDLPGIYSLIAYSFEEEIARNEILNKAFDLYIYVCDANNLGRNLYLALQLLELDVPLVILINMMDELHKQGKTIDAKKIQKKLGVPVFCVSARRGFDGRELLNNITKYSNDFLHNDANLPYLSRLPLDTVKNIIKEKESFSKEKISRYECIKVLENDEYVLKGLNLSPFKKQKINSLGDYQTEIAANRYEFIDKIIDDVYVKKDTTNKIFNIDTSTMDNVLLNKYMAFPIFILIMSCIFWITFGSVGKIISEFLNDAKELLIKTLQEPLINSKIPIWMSELLLYGIIDGVGGVVVFLPQIIILFFFLSLLEDSGYISRVAFMTDGFFRKIGLNGRAVFTILMGLGCSASAILTSRGLDDENMRKKAIILTPYISCSARLPVYTAIAAAFFSKGKLFIVILMYLIGVFVAIALAACFENSSLKSGNSSFMMEMPNYRFPTAERILQILLNNVKTFLVKVGTVVLCVNIIVWVLCNFSFTSGFVKIGYGESVMEKLSSLIASIFTPLGFGNWRATTALLSGLMAKEVVISTLASLGGVEAAFSDSLSALCFLIYTLLYIPCIATLAAIKKEAGIKWTVFAVVLQFIVAYLCTFAFRITAIAFKNGAFFGVCSLAFWCIIVLLLSTVFKINFRERRCARCNEKCRYCK